LPAIAEIWCLPGRRSKAGFPLADLNYALGRSKASCQQI